MRATRNRVYGQPYQGFESLLLRQNIKNVSVPCIGCKKLLALRCVAIGGAACGVNKKIIKMKTFNEQVYDVVARIPTGRVATFGQIARMIGRPRMARFVGYASNNKASWHLPWHRVVFKDGSLCGAAFFEQQYKALRAEGVKFTKEKTVIMEQFQWDPERDAAPMDLRDLPLVF